jgi:hypothetical protein
MKNKFQIAMLLGSLLLIFQQLNAQPNHPPRKQLLTPEERAAKITLDLKERLSLTEEQAQKVKTIFIKREEIRDAELKDKQEQRKKWDDEMNQILNPEQLAAYRKIQEERKSRMQEQRKQGHQE